MPGITKISPETLQEAAGILRAGGLVAFPTETVYGLGADATDGEAVARIFEAKGRPRFNPLIVHVASRKEAARLAEFNADAGRLADAFWPGPLTLVLPRREGGPLSELVSAGLPTVALRMPAHEAALALIRAAGAPIAAPSANPSGRLSPTEAAHVAADLGDRVDMILDGGPCAAGLESTIVGLPAADGDPLLLRAGAIASADIEAVLGRELKRASPGDKPDAPGMLASHYAPRARLRLDAEAPREGEAHLGFAARAAEGPLSLNLSARGDLREAAANLFSYLRRLDRKGVETIAVAPIPDDGLGEAINDRLRRAAAPRPKRRS